MARIIIITTTTLTSLFRMNHVYAHTVVLRIFLYLSVRVGTYYCELVIRNVIRKNKIEFHAQMLLQHLVDRMNLSGKKV